MKYYPRTVINQTTDLTQTCLDSLISFENTILSDSELQSFIARQLLFRFLPVPPLLILKPMTTLNVLDIQFANGEHH